jgi:hypothetical protein
MAVAAAAGSKPCSAGQLARLSMREYDACASELAKIGCAKPEGVATSVEDGGEAGGKGSTDVWPTSMELTCCAEPPSSAAATQLLRRLPEALLDALLRELRGETRKGSETGRPSSWLVVVAVVLAGSSASSPLREPRR